MPTKSWTLRHAVHFSTPIGNIVLVSDGDALCGLYWLEGSVAELRNSYGMPAPNDLLLTHTFDQLSEYFNRKRYDFDVPLHPRGTKFQKAVWSELLKIPYGETRSYGEVARRLGKPNASRAVGLANAKNPIAVIIPCHRVIGSNGKLVGYGGGIEYKKYLLDLEASNKPAV